MNRIARKAGRLVCSEKGHVSPLIRVVATASECSEVTVVTSCLRCGDPIQQVCVPQHDEVLVPA